MPKTPAWFSASILDPDTTKERILRFPVSVMIGVFGCDGAIFLLDSVM